MEMPFLTDAPLFTWVILPLLIFFARILDVSIGTLRLIFVSKGYKFYAPILGFFEVVIWLLAIGQIMQHLDNLSNLVHEYFKSNQDENPDQNDPARPHRNGRMYNFTR